MLKVLHAERAKNALTLPILSYDAPPEDAQLGDEFRKLLRRAKGTVTTENHSSLSELVAAAVTAGVMQPSAPPPEPVASKVDAHDNRELGGDGAASQATSPAPVQLGVAGHQQTRSLNEDKTEGTPSEPTQAEVASCDDGDSANVITVPQRVAGDSEDDAVDVDANALQAAISEAGGGASPNDDNGAEGSDDATAFAQSSPGEATATAPADFEQKASGDNKAVDSRAVDHKAKFAEKSGGATLDNESLRDTAAASETIPLADYGSDGLTSKSAPSTSAALKEVEAQPRTAAADTSQRQFYARDAEIARFIADSAGAAVKRSGEASAQMLLLRQSFEHLQSHGREGISAASGASAGNTNGFSSSSFGVGGRASSVRDSSGRERGEAQPMPRNVALRMLERVQVTLKEAARSRDGKTLSLNLEPVDLGRIKVDVSLREGALHARLTPENSQVLQALREHAHELQAALRKLGLDVERVTVTVSGEESREEPSFDGNQLGDGKGFQDDRNNMPHSEAQVVENTFGNELAEGLGAAPEEAKSATTVWRDNWVA